MALGARCPVCDDPAPYCLWIDFEPPSECPLGAGRVTDCEYQMAKAHQSALYRRVAPECFDENGNVKPGNIAGRFIKKAMEAEPGFKPVFGITEAMMRRAGRL